MAATTHAAPLPLREGGPDPNHDAHIIPPDDNEVRCVSIPYSMRFIVGDAHQVAQAIATEEGCSILPSDGWVLHPVEPSGTPVQTLTLMTDSGDNSAATSAAAARIVESLHRLHKFGSEPEPDIGPTPAPAPASASAPKPASAPAPAPAPAISAVADPSPAPVPAPEPVHMHVPAKTPEEPQALLAQAADIAPLQTILAAMDALDDRLRARRSVAMSKPDAAATLAEKLGDAGAHLGPGCTWGQLLDNMVSQQYLQEGSSGVAPRWQGNTTASRKVPKIVCDNMLQVVRMYTQDGTPKLVSGLGDFLRDKLEAPFTPNQLTKAVGYLNVTAFIRDFPDKVVLAGEGPTRTVQSKTQVHPTPAPMSPLVAQAADIASLQTILAAMDALDGRLGTLRSVAMLKPDAAATLDEKLGDAGAHLGPGCTWGQLLDNMVAQQYLQEGSSGVAPRWQGNTTASRKVPKIVCDNMLESVHMYLQDGTPKPMQKFGVFFSDELHAPFTPNQLVRAVGYKNVSTFLRDFPDHVAVRHDNNFLSAAGTPPEPQKPTPDVDSSAEQDIPGKPSSDHGSPVQPPPDQPKCALSGQPCTEAVPLSAAGGPQVFVERSVLLKKLKELKEVGQTEVRIQGITVDVNAKLDELLSDGQGDEDDEDQPDSGGCNLQ